MFGGKVGKENQHVKCRRRCRDNIMYNAFKRLSRAYSPTERAALFHDTAAKVYRIDVEPPRG